MLEEATQKSQHLYFCTIKARGGDTGGANARMLEGGGDTGGKDVCVSICTIVPLKLEEETQEGKTSASVFVLLYH
jgi:hypothetical protein